MPSIVDPATQLGGAWTVTRSIVGLLRHGPLRADVEVIAVPQRSRMARRFWQTASVGKSLFSGFPSKVEFTRTRALLARVLDLCREPADLIIVNGTDLAWLLPHLPPTVNRALIAHNIEHQLFESQLGESLRKVGARNLLRRDLSKLRGFELQNLARAGNVIFLSTLDYEYARVHCHGLRCIVVPPVFEGPPRSQLRGSRVADALHIGMLANFEWWPNRHGLGWFLDLVFPHISPSIHLHLFGNQSQHAAPLHPRIHRHGYASSLADVWGECDMMIAPIFCGGGVCVKVAEALYYGMPVLASHFAVGGLPLDPDPSIVLLDRGEDWIEFLNSGAESLARRIVPRFIADRFSARAHCRRLSEFLLHSGSCPA